MPAQSSGAASFGSSSGSASSETDADDQKDGHESASERGQDRRWRSHAVVLALGTFAVGTDAFVIAGVLPSIAATLAVSIGAAGQLVTVFSLAYALAAPVIGVATARWSRRRALLVALGVFTVGNAATALAPTYPLVLASRVVAAVGAALFTASASAAAARLAGPARRGQAIALVMLGLTSSLVLGTPIGTAVAAISDWRATLWLVTALGALAATIVAARLPALHPDATTAAARTRDALAPLRDRRVLGVLAATFVVFLGIYTPYTYFSAVYAPATTESGNRLALLLLVFGLAATAGNLAAGALADRLGPRHVIIAATLLLTAAFAAVPALRDSMALAVPAVVVTGWLSFSVTTPQQHQIIALAPGAETVVTSLYQSVLYLAISASGVLGALGLELLDATYLAPLAAAVVLIAAAITASGPAGRAGRAEHTHPGAS